MNAEPFLAEVARHLAELDFDVVLSGNAAAALQGAPVTTVDFDFMFRKTSVNMRKLKELAGRLGRRNKLAALERESERDLVELIRRRLALPVEQRMNFLRKRVSFRGSAL